MKTGLSKREKVLVILTAVLVVAFVSFRFVISPLNERYALKTEEFDRKANEKMLIENKLALEGITREGHEQLEAEFEEIVERFPAVSPNEEIDKILTDLCLRNNLKPTTLAVTTTGSSAGASQNEPQQEPAFVITEVSMLMHGEYDSLKRLIAAVEGIEYVKIAKMSFSYPVDAGRYTTPNISVFFEVTMLSEETIAHTPPSGNKGTAD